MPSIPCANVGKPIKDQRSPCLKPATNACKGCFLVQYCSRECQVAHWSQHKLDCKSPLMKLNWKPAWEEQHRQPTFITSDGSPFAVGLAPYGMLKFLWGNVPAINVLGPNIDLRSGDIKLLFAASGDIRNAVVTLAELPTSYTGRCKFVINDRDFDIVARNVIILLSALNFKAEDAVPIMLHIWYSALIPGAVLQSIQELFLPLIQDVCTKIRNKPEISLQSKTWTCGSRTCRLVFEKQQWDKLLSYFQVPFSLSAEQAQKIRLATTLAPERTDNLHRALFSQPPGWRVCTMDFRKNGILKPFGASLIEFNTPNPTFYQTKDSWPMQDSADPLEGWSITEVLKKASLSKNDIYGSLYLYIHAILLKFCERIQNLSLDITFYHLDATSLLPILAESKMGSKYFDRIEISNVIDTCYLGPVRTLFTFAPLLKPHCNSTLLGLFLNATHEVYTTNDYLKSTKVETDRLAPYIPFSRSLLEHAAQYGAEFLQFNDARYLVRDYDELWERYVRVAKLEEVSKAVGLKIREVNRIMEKWPLRLKNGAGKREFELLAASAHFGCERYVEWTPLL